MSGSAGGSLASKVFSFSHLYLSFILFSLVLIMKALIRFTLLLIAIQLLSCNPKRDPHKPMLVPSSSGNPYEVLVVADDSIWGTEAGKALRKVLNSPVPMLPQDEPSFHVTRIKLEDYDRIFNLFRNIIFLKIDDDYRGGKILFDRNVNAYPQVIINIHAENNRQMAEYIAENKSSLINFLYNEELVRQCDYLSYNHNYAISDTVKKVLGCDIFVPSDLLKVKTAKDFVWISNDGLSTVQNIVVYSYPYATQKVFDKQGFIALRDTFLGRNIPGYNPGSKMQTNKEVVQVNNFNKNGQFIQEGRGLWEMSGDAMGGPFISLSRIDSVNNRVIVAETFVYAPSKMKRSILRRLEASLYTLNMYPELDDKKEE